VVGENTNGHEERRNMFAVPVGQFLGHQIDVGQ